MSVSKSRQRSEYSFCIVSMRGPPVASAARSHSVVPQAVSFDRPKARILPSATRSFSVPMTSAMLARIAAMSRPRASKPHIWRKW